MASRRALIVCTSCSTFRKTGERTGGWVEEVAAPYIAFTAAGYQVDITTPGGAAVPWDPASEADDKMTAACRAFMADSVAQDKCKAPISLSKVINGGDYNVIYLAGGHGAMFDFPNNKTLATCVGAAAAANRVVAAVCHGVCGLLHVADPRTGQLLLAGKRACSFTSEEEIQVGKQKVVPFTLERAVEKCGATFCKGAPWASNVVRDGQLVTGQNPQSSTALAEECLRAAEELAGQPTTPRPM
jgi:putative intracellular protease/amidase